LRAPFSERELPKANDAAVNKNAISICIPSSPDRVLGTGRNWGHICVMAESLRVRLLVLIQLSLSGTQQMAAGNMPKKKKKLVSLAMRENYLTVVQKEKEIE